MSSGFDFYRIKMAYQGTDDQGAVVLFKTEDLVMATCYSETEKIAFKLSEGKDEFGKVEYEILKTKISEVVYNNTFVTDTELTCGLVTYYFEEDDNTEVGLYAVSVVYREINEKTGKERKTSETIYVPAYSSKEAIDNTNAYLKQVGETRDWTIPNVKYDKAQSVLVTVEQHQNNIRVK